MFQGPKLGELLLEAGVIDELQLSAALGEQRRWGGRLGITLIKLGLLAEHDLVRALATQIGVPVARLEGKRIRPEVQELVPAELARRYLCLPLFLKEELGVDTLYLGMEDPCDLDALDALGFRTGLRVRPVMVAPSELLDAIDRLYGATSSPSPSRQSAPPAPIDIGAPPPSEPPAADATGPMPVHATGPTPVHEIGLMPVQEMGPMPLEAADTEPMSVPQEAPAAQSAGPHGASTRTILRAVTQLLIEKELIARDELYERVNGLRESAGE